MNSTKGILTIIFLCFFTLATAQKRVSPKFEYRAVWLTTIENLDWPKTLVKAPSDTLAQQRELVFLLDSLQSLNVNSILLQTRVRGDVIYPSSIEPFSHVLTGVEGRSPGYDPLAFAIKECHKRGMQLHAWVVALPLGKDEHIKRMDALSLVKKKRDLCTPYKGSWYMEPGNPATADYLCRLVSEIVSRYDVDGLHLDYIRYPDRTVGYPDHKLHKLYGKGLSLASWRRQNVTNVARRVYSLVKGIKPWVRVSCAPLGKYDDLTCYPSYGWNAHDAVFQEAQEWMRCGFMDILFPMLYFNGNNFYPFVRDWQENSYGRHIVPGIGVYRLLPEYGGWPAVDITRQLNTSRDAGTAGSALFRTAHLLGEASGVAGVYKSVYGRKSLVPPMTWAAAELPASPASLLVLCEGDTFRLSWPLVAPVENHPKVKYNVYAALGDTVDVENIENLIAAGVQDTSFAWSCRTDKAVSLAVTAIDAYGRESTPVRWSVGASYAGVRELSLPEFHKLGLRLVVCDMYGRKVYSGRFSTRVIVRNLPAGHYSARVYGRDGRVVWGGNFRR